MPSAPHVSRAAVGIACLGVAVGVGVSVAAQAARRQTKSSAAEVDHPLRQWSEKQVSEWLVRIGVSEQTVKVFRGEVLNGSGLLDLSEQDIVLLSANAKDAEAILNALRCCPKGGELEAFLNDTQAMFVSLATERPKSSEELSRQLLRVLYAFKSFQLLPKEAQVSALLPMSRQVASALKVVQECNNGDVGDGVAVDDGKVLPPGMTPERLRETVKALHEMLDKFLETSRLGLDQLPESECNELKNRILHQVGRVTEISRAMPASVGDVLVEKCNAIRSELSKKSSDPVLEAEGNVDCMPELLYRLRELFRSVKDGSALQLAPTERTQRISEMIAELESVEAKANQCPESEQKKMVLSVSKTVGDLLRQMAELAEQEMSLRGLNTQRKEKLTDSTKDDLDAVVTDLAQIFQFLNSDEFACISADRRPGIVMRLSRDVEKLKERICAFDDPGKDAVLRDLVQPLQDLLSTMEGLVEEDELSDFETVKEMLMDIKNLIQTDDFQNADDGSKNRIIKAVRDQINRISSTLDSLTEDEKRAAQQIIDEICDSLNTAIRVEEVDPENAETKSVENVQRDIMITVQDAIQVIQQPTFLNLSAEEQVDIVNNTLEKLSSARTEALSLGVSGNPIVLFIDNLVERLEALSVHHQ